MISSPEDFWDDLLPLIDDGQVVPIVGRDVLQMANGRMFHRMLAEQLADNLRTSIKETVSEISVAGPGFINFTFSD